MLEKTWTIWLLWPLLWSAPCSLAPTQSSDSFFLLRTTTLPVGEDVEKSTLTSTRNYTAIPKPEDRGLRVAVLASVVSGIIILAMSASFVICCLQERMSKDTCEWRDINSRKTEKHHSCHRSKYWLEKEVVDWDAFPPPKIYHLPQHAESRPHLSNPMCAGGLTGYDNCGYLRSQESLLSIPLPGLYRTESQVYPVILQRVSAPTAPTEPSAPSAPVYLHLSTTSLTDNPPTQPALPNPNLTTAAPNPHYYNSSHCNYF